MFRRFYVLQTRQLKNSLDKEVTILWIILSETMMDINILRHGFHAEHTKLVFDRAGIQNLV